MEKRCGAWRTSRGAVHDHSIGILLLPIAAVFHELVGCRPRVCMTLPAVVGANFNPPRPGFALYCTMPSR